MMHRFSFIILYVVSFCFAAGFTPAQNVNPEVSFHDEIEGPFDNGMAVTKSCLGCHEEQGAEMLKSAHWMWKGPTPFVEGHENRKDIGKANLINNF